MTSFRTLRRTIRSSRSSDISLPREQQPRAVNPQRLSNARFICAIILWRRMSSAAASGPVAALERYSTAASSSAWRAITARHSCAVTISQYDANSALLAGSGSRASVSTVSSNRIASAS